MATITASSNLYNSFKLRYNENNGAANLASAVTIEFGNDARRNRLFNRNLLRSTPALSCDLTVLRYGGVADLTPQASLSQTIPTFIRLDFDKMNLPEGVEVRVDIERGFFVEETEKYPDSLGNPSPAINEFFTFTMPERGIVFSPIISSVSAVIWRIFNFEIDTDSLFTPTFSAVAQRVGEVDIQVFAGIDIDTTYTIAGASVTTGSNFNQISLGGYLQKATSAFVNETDLLLDYTRVRFDEATFTSAFTASNPPGDRIRFSESNLVTDVNTSITTLESVRRNTSSSINSVSSLTASISIPITQTAVITDPDEDPVTGGFGGSLSIDGNNIVVANAFYDNAGKAYVFNATSGALIRSLENPNQTDLLGEDDRFGAAVDISGDYAVIGAPLEDGAGGEQQGKAYLFDITTGTLLQSETNPNDDTDYYFGQSVAIDGNQWVVGQEDTGFRVYPVSTGNSYIPNEVNALDRDYKVDISGNNVIVSVSRNLGINNTIYKLYHYTLSPATLVRTIDNPNPISSEYQDYFGRDLAVYGDYALVGAVGEDTGRAYVFDLTDGSLLHTFSRPAGTASTSGSTLSNFAKSVAMDSRYAVISDNDYVHIFDYVAGYLEKSIPLEGAGDVSISGRKFIVRTDIPFTSAGRVEVFTF